jgi:hypothetical protein
MRCYGVIEVMFSCPQCCLCTGCAPSEGAEAAVRP